MVEKVIKTISKLVDIKCKQCGYEGYTTTTQVYYTNCPNCEESVFIGHLTQNH